MPNHFFGLEWMFSLKQRKTFILKTEDFYILKFLKQQNNVKKKHFLTIVRNIYNELVLFVFCTHHLNVVKDSRYFLYPFHHLFRVLSIFSLSRHLLIQRHLPAHGWVFHLKPLETRVEFNLLFFYCFIKLSFHLFSIIILMLLI